MRPICTAEVQAATNDLCRRIRAALNPLPYFFDDAMDDRH